MCVRPRDTTIEVIGDYLIMMRKAVQQQTSSNFLLSKLDSPRTLSRPRLSLNNQILSKIHFQSHLASSISQPRRGRGSKFVVRRSSSNLVDSLIDSSFKVKRNREDSNDAYSISYWLIHRTDTHSPLELMSIVCPLWMAHLNSLGIFEGKEVDDDCRPEL